MNNAMDIHGYCYSVCLFRDQELVGTTVYCSFLQYLPEGIQIPTDRNRGGWVGYGCYLMAVCVVAGYISPIITNMLMILSQELEDAVLLDSSPSKLLVQLFCIFLNGIVDKDIT